MVAQCDFNGPGQKWTGSPMVPHFQQRVTADGRVLLHNFLSLSVLQAANYLLPLVILPYLVRMIGVEKLGLIVFAQAVIQYFNIVTDYGFHLSATRDIAANRNDTNRIAVIFSSIMAIKTVLLVLGFGILLLMVIEHFLRMNKTNLMIKSKRLKRKLQVMKMKKLDHLGRLSKVNQK